MCLKKMLLMFLLLADIMFAINLEKVYVSIILPSPDTKGKVTLEKAIASRRSVRDFKNEALTISELGQLLWAAQGITAKWGGRTAPSAGATYPLEIYIAAGNVQTLQQGLYRYIPYSHTLEKISDMDLRKNLCDAAYGQKALIMAPVVIIISADFSRTQKRYGERGFRYVYIEAGHVSQNIYLQAETLNIGTVAIGAFDDKQVKSILKINEDVIYLMPVGKKK